MGRYFNTEGTLNSYNISPHEILVDDRFGYKIIAIIYNDYWTAYRGLTDWADGEVAARGDVVPESIAIYLFPTLTFDRSYGEFE